MSFQRVAFAHLLASTIWAPRSLVSSANIRMRLVLVQLSLWTLLAVPVHKLVAGKGGVVGMNAICSIALVIPFKEQWVLHCFKCWLLCVPSHSFVTTTHPLSFCTRGATPACHSWLQVGHFHSALNLLPASICSGVLAFLSWFQYGI